MKKVDFRKLVREYKDSKRLIWIFVKTRSDMANANTLIEAFLYLPDNDDEEEEMYNSHVTFMELATFQDVVIVEGNAGRTSDRDIAEGCIYYRDKDTFRD